jgi:chromosome segregation protein
VKSELRLESAREALNMSIASIQERFEETAEELAIRIGNAFEKSDEGRESTVNRLDQLKGERERLGAVNLRADEELTEIEDRKNALSTEQNELVEAIRRLRSAIGSLNREGRERLLTAFEEVKTHFERLFVSLFGGGTARLELIESDDPLEAGLEILAHPPGKKPSTMSLLSGGEQALTAIALIFAVFLTNPSPICVLDEVDAPLDDANVERYCDLLNDMARTTETRFIVITHNPITMARMNRLFGVTMAERGVSQLVSVDLGGAEELLQAS